MSDARDRRGFGSNTKETRVGRVSRHDLRDSVANERFLKVLFYPFDSSLILLLRVIIRMTGYGSNIQDQCKYRFKFVLFGYHTPVCNLIFISPHDHTS